MEKIDEKISFLPDCTLAISAMLFFVSERIVDEGSLRWGFLVVALGLFLFSVARRGRDYIHATKGRRYHAGLFLLASAFVAVGVAGYFVHLYGMEAEGENSVLLFIVSLFCGVTSLIVAGMLCAAVGPVRFVPEFDGDRMRQAAFRGLTISMVLAALFFFNFAAVKADWRYDFSFGGPAKPSPATQSLIEAADRDIEVFLFFPKGSSVLVEVLDYFEGLREMGVRLEIIDQALDPELSKDLKVSRNGTIALRSGERTESWFLSDKRKGARRKLKKLDEEIRTRLSKISRDEKIVYFTRGHGERDSRKAKKGKRLSGAGVNKLLKSLNAKARDLGVAEGLGNRIPEDADLIVIFGPTKPFSDAEVTVLTQWVQNEGAILILVDPEAEHNLHDLHAALQVRSAETEICNDQEYIKNSRTIADHAFIFSTSFTSHKAVKTLSAVRGKAAVFFLQAGQIERRSQEELSNVEKYRITSLARTRGGAFEDAVKNRVFDEKKEVRKVLDLAVAVESLAKENRGMRAVVVGDSDVLADGIIANEANQLFAYEALLWLLRDDQTVMGKPQLEEDVPIRHSREQDVIWFYGTIFIVPVLMCGCAFFARPSRRRRKGS